MNILKFFKFDWLNSEERKELEQLRKEKELVALQKENLELTKENIRQDAKNEVLEQVNKIIDKEIETQTKNPYKSVRIIGDSMYVILQDGTTISGSKDLYNIVKEAKTEQEVLELFTVKIQDIPEQTGSGVFQETEEEREQIKDNLRIFRNNPDFEIKNEVVYMTGISLPLPAVVAASFIEILEKVDAIDFGAGNVERQSYSTLSESYQALKMFWLKLAVNPLENSRSQLLTFVKKNDVRITATGNLVLYRRVIKVGDTDRQLVDFISQQYTKVKAWKKSPKNYFVVEEKEEYAEIVKVDKGHYEEAYNGHDDDDDSWDYDDQEWVPNMIDETVIKTRVVLKLRKSEEAFVGNVKGNLQDLYLDLPNMKENTYTSSHNKGKYTIRVGGIYKIDDSELDVNADVCNGGGLHAANVNYGYGGYGDTPVVVLVNPSKALTIPSGDMGKLRTTEMFVMCVNDKPQGEHYDDVMLYDEEYNKYTIEELEQAVATKDFSSLNIQDRQIQVNEKDLAAITEKLKNRVVTI